MDDINSPVSTPINGKITSPVVKFPSVIAVTMSLFL
jgi:hypothetical protein